HTPIEEVPSKIVEPLLDEGLALADGNTVFTGGIGSDNHPWVRDHRLFGRIVVPGTALVDMVAHAADRVGSTTVADLLLEAPLVLTDSGRATLQVTVGIRDDQGRREVHIHSRREHSAADTPWPRHASGTLTESPAHSVEPSAPGGAAVMRTQWPPAGGAQAIARHDYARLARRGYDYGPTFQGLQGTWLRAGELLAEVELLDTPLPDGAFHGPHPALVDATLHALLLHDDVDERALMVPFA